MAELQSASFLDGIIQFGCCPVETFVRSDAVAQEMPQLVNSPQLDCRYLRYGQLLLPNRQVALFLRPLLVVSSGIPRPIFISANKQRWAFESIGFVFLYFPRQFLVSMANELAVLHFSIIEHHSFH